MARDRIVAVGLLTQADLDALGPVLQRAWPVEEAPSFTELLSAIDDADRALARVADHELKGDRP